MNVEQKINWIKENPGEAYCNLITTVENAKYFDKQYGKLTKDIKLGVSGSWSKEQCWKFSIATRDVLLEMIDKGMRLETIKEKYPELYEEGGVFYKNK